MVETASMEIGGSLDSTEIENSLTRIEQKLDDFKAQTESSAGSVMNLGKAAKSLSKILITIGTAGVAALTGLASVAPAVAPALAKMQIGFMKISHTLGRQLQPLFESIANELIPAIGSAIDRFSPQIEKFASAAAGGVSKIASAIREFNVGELITFSAAGLAGAVAGFAIGGWPGAMIGLALGTYLGTTLVPTASAEMKESFGAYAETATAVAEAGPLTATSIFNPFGPIGVIGSGRTALNAIIDTIEWIFNKATNKEMAFSSKNGIG